MINNKKRFLNIYLFNSIFFYLHFIHFIPIPLMTEKQNKKYIGGLFLLTF